MPPAYKIQVKMQSSYSWWFSCVFSFFHLIEVYSICPEKKRRSDHHFRHPSPFSFSFPLEIFHKISLLPPPNLCAYCPILFFMHDTNNSFHVANDRNSSPETRVVAGFAGFCPLEKHENLRYDNSVLKRLTWRNDSLDDSMWQQERLKNDSLNDTKYDL